MSPILAKPRAHPHYGLTGSLADVLTNQMPGNSVGQNFQTSMLSCITLISQCHQLLIFRGVRGCC